MALLQIPCAYEPLSKENELIAHTELDLGPCYAAAFSWHCPVLHG